jgi:hypothetical protein
MPTASPAAISGGITLGMQAAQAILGKYADSFG